MRVDGEFLEGALLGGRYRVVRRLGAGGMSVVHLATDEALGRDVAIKLFRDGVSGAGDTGRRASEARTLASLSHPGLVTLFDAVLDGDPTFLVMEYVDGEDLAARIHREGPIAAPQARSLLAVAADALAAVHARGIVHRDLKPANLLLPRTPSVPVKLADFGIARLIDATRLTTAGSLIGTAAYLSPEQVRGHDIGPASDVYALALVVLEGLTGLRGFDGGPAEAATARLSSSPRGLTALEPAWRELLERMLELDPEARPTAAEVRDAAAALPDDALAGAQTALLPQDGSEQPATERMPGPATVDTPTLVLRADTAAPTEALPEAPAAPSPAGSADTPHASRRRRRIPVIVAAGVGAVVVVAAVVAGLGSISNGPGPDPEPSYPAVAGTLGEHLERLQRDVEP